MGIKKALATIVLAGAMALGVCGKAKADFLIGTAESVLDKNQNPAGVATYINPDANFMLNTIWPLPPYIASRTLDEETGLWNEPVSLGIPGDNSAGYLSPDGNTLYYASQGPQRGDIFRSHKSNGSWGAGEVVSNVNTSNADHHPSFNGKQLYFQWLYDEIYVADYNPQTDQFSTSRPVDSVNTAQYRDQAPWVSLDGKLLLFESNRPGGHGGFDIWYATRDSLQDDWSNVTNLGPKVNTSGNEGHARFAENAELLFFARDGVPMQVPTISGLRVAIDIKPGSDPNSINLSSKGVIPVAIFGSDSFDVYSIDKASLKLEGSTVKEKGKKGIIGAFEDINEDSFYDLIVPFYTSEMDLEPGALEAKLTGQLLDGSKIFGTDYIQIVNPEPTTLGLLGAGGLAAILAGKKKK